MSQEQVAFQTSDGITIIGNFIMPQDARKAVLLLHMMPAAKESYDSLAQAFNKNKIATLAIDLRGHGESKNTMEFPVRQHEKQLDYTKFSDEQHQTSRLDVDASINFLAQKGFPASQVSLVGASIGANLSLDAMRRYKEIKRCVLLSAGLDYRGVLTEPAMRSIGQEQKVWIIAAEDDRYSTNSSKTLQSLNPTNSTLTVFNGSDHGTNLFNSQPEPMANIVRFISS